MPELDPTVAVPVIPLVHSPPVGEQLSVVVAPVQTVADPEMDPGVDVTVTGCTSKHPELKMYVIFATPAPMPVTTPVPDPTVARPGLLLSHVPPDGEELNVIVAPTHTAEAPEIVEGAVFTVTVAIDSHPVPSE